MTRIRIEMAKNPIAELAEYARIPIAFRVTHVLDVTGDDVDGIVLSECKVEIPYVKDYDAVAGNGPMEWERRFDMSRFFVFVARLGDARIGGAAIVLNPAWLTGDRRDEAMLWDIRVAPSARRRGVGSALFEHVERWAQSNGCRELTIETQNTNVPACRFYARHGCGLTACDRSAYAELPSDVQLVWSKTLS